MKITYHIGNKELTYNASAVPPIGTKVLIETDDPELINLGLFVTDVTFKLFLADPNIYDEVHVFLAIDVEDTLANILTTEIESIKYTSTSTE